MQNIYIKLLEKLRQRYIQKHGIPQYYNPCKEIDPNIKSNQRKFIIIKTLYVLKIRFSRNWMCNQLFRYLSSKKRYYKIHKGRGIPLVVEKGNDTYYEK